MKNKGFINIYRSGYFHREGKPGNMDRHSGDVYAEYEEAVKHIDPPTHYVSTIPIEWEDMEQCVVNPPDSVPVPITVSRKRFATA